MASPDGPAATPPPGGTPRTPWRSLRPRTRLFLAGTGAALILGAALRAAVHGQLSTADPTYDEPSMDGRIFMEWAARIAAGDLLGSGAFFFNPLYAYAVAPVVGLAGDGALGAIRILQGILGLATVVLVAGATRRLLGRREAAVAALLAAAWPAAVYFEGIPIGATLGVFLNSLALRLLAGYRVRPGPGRALGAGSVIGLAVLSRPNVILFPAVLPAWLVRLFPGEGRLRRTAAAGALVLCGVALPLLPSLARNLAVLGEPVLTTTSMGVNLHLSNNPLAWRTGRMDSPDIAFNPFLLEEQGRVRAEAGAGRPLSPGEVSSWWTARALEDCAREPGRAALFLARKSLYFCGAHELPSSESFEQARRDSPVLRLLSVPLSFAAILPFAILGAASVLRRRRRALPLVLLALVYAAGLVVFFPLSHYRLPVIPALLPLAAAGLVGLGGLLARGAWRASAAPLALVAAGALLSHGNLLAAAAGVPALGPFPEPAAWILSNRAHSLVDRALWRSGKGDAAGRARDLDLAGREARRALDVAADGDNATWLVHAALARVAAARGLLEEEARHLGTALALSPGQPRLLADSGLNLLRRGRRAEAIEAARAAAEGGAPLDPELAEALAAAK